MTPASTINVVLFPTPDSPTVITRQGAKATFDGLGKAESVCGKGLYKSGQTGCQQLQMSKSSPLACDVQAGGMQAVQDLENSLRSFSAMLENDTNVDRAKQEVPFKQQEALLFVGRIEEAMVQGFPFKVPEQYDNLPQLLVRLPQLGKESLVCVKLGKHRACRSRYRFPERSVAAD